MKPNKIVDLLATALLMIIGIVLIYLSVTYVSNENYPNLFIFFRACIFILILIMIIVLPQMLNNYVFESIIKSEKELTSKNYNKGYDTGIENGRIQFLEELTNNPLVNDSLNKDIPIFEYINGEYAKIGTQTLYSKCREVLRESNNN